ncbi:aldehyde dehydrogenase [Asticcacaulis benevestitus]|uniref:Gamma-glutamyl-gamma-aminobutyraldehyde dehydrogenase n=1 Tax=Asticcacaulis benevestitus DSM 16100 = ATCC BAA-896 TaxID=1121022 RepID=V4PIV9_9CAUL|nr:aldehyde dehydrogenase [Asticcacaulis benevestitus]ESQ93897.1 gamma-glutamyl-gamma-aminobutyraldehyde dehydrogenase [Asticcacaulis benevestitus DSM 16100 = ATCC BAA-896]
MPVSALQTPADTLEGVLASIRALTLPDKAVIEGMEVLSASGRTFDNFSSRDGKLINKIAACDRADVDAAVHSARQAFEDGRWRALAPKVRKKILHRLADLMTGHAENLSLLESLDTGKPISDARNVDIPLAINSTRYYAEALDKVYGEVAPSPEDRLSYVVHEPLGVIGAIVPWNFPLHMAMWKVAPALAMGNSVVLKPAENSSMTALYTAQLALEAGVPAGVWNVIPGLGGEAGDALSRHMDVDMITFTGSGPIGRQLMRASADSNLKRVSLELGGKSPQIVFADSDDLDGAAANAAWGVFYNQGQVCTAASRLLVEETIKDAFVAKVIAVAKTIRVGDPFDPKTQFGAMISERQMNTALDYIEKGQAEGGKLLLGGERVRSESGGYYVAPSLLDIAQDNILAQEEVFGPVLSVLTFNDEQDAYRIANNTIYGLASGVWTSNIGKAMRAAKALKAGLVWVNGWDACDITSPFGGVKQSGFGRDRSLHALYKYADLKAVSISFKA